MTDTMSDHVTTMSTDNLTGLDDKPLAADRNNYRVDRPRVPQRTYSPETKRFLKHRRQQRQGALIREGRTVLNGKCGATVFHKDLRPPMILRAPRFAYTEVTPAPVLRPSQVKRRVSRWMENHPGELPRNEVD